VKPPFFFLAESDAALLGVFPGKEDFFFSRPCNIKTDCLLALLLA
jgi:hypothetical protein